MGSVLSLPLVIVDWTRISSPRSSSPDVVDSSWEDMGGAKSWAVNSDFVLRCIPKDGAPEARPSYGSNWKRVSSLSMSGRVLMMISQCRRLGACLLPGHFQIRDVTHEVQSNVIKLHHHRTRNMENLSWFSMQKCGTCIIVTTIPNKNAEKTIAGQTLTTAKKNSGC